MLGDDGVTSIGVHPQETRTLYRPLLPGCSPLSDPLPHGNKLSNAYLIHGCRQLHTRHPPLGNTLPLPRMGRLVLEL